jgi:hypothetical protein
MQKQWWNSKVVLAVMSLGLIASVVRSAWLVCLLGVLVYVVSTAVKSRAARTAVWVLLVAIVALVASFVIDLVQENVSSQFLIRAGNTGTYSARLMGYANLHDMGVIQSIYGEGVATMQNTFRPMDMNSDTDAFLPFTMCYAPPRRDSLVPLGRRCALWRSCCQYWLLVLAAAISP